MPLVAMPTSGISSTNYGSLGGKAVESIRQKLSHNTELTDGRRSRVQLTFLLQGE